jgi:hypothetical protein
MDALATTTAIDDTIKTAMYDAICDADGKASVFFLKHHLAKHGLVIVEGAKYGRMLTALQVIGSYESGGAILDSIGRIIRTARNALPV